MGPFNFYTLIAVTEKIRNLHIRVPVVWKYLFCVVILLFGSFPRVENSYYARLFKGQYAHAGLHSGFFYSEEELEFLDHQITRLMIDNQFNGNVLVARYGMLIYEKSFGFSSFTRSVPMDIETTFQLASITKTFTATAILMLQEEGFLSVDDKVKKHLPDFPYDNITIRQMLNHTSGLQNYMWMVERHWRSRSLPTNRDILDLFLRHPRPLNFTPGQRFDYSNTGYVFLALLIEEVSGLSYRDYIHQCIFDPLEMNRSFVYDLHDPPAMDNRAYGYRQWRGRHIIIPDDNLDGPLGDKGIFSTVHDLFKWDQALYRSELLPPSAWQQAFENARLNNDSLVNYGLGWRLQTYLDKPIVHHPGRWHGFRTSFKRFLDDHTTIIVLSNNNRGILDVIEGIQNLVYYDEKEIWMAARDEELTDDYYEEYEE